MLQNYNKISEEMFHMYYMHSDMFRSSLHTSDYQTIIYITEVIFLQVSLQNYKKKLV